MTRRADDGLSYHAWFEAGLSIEGRTIILESTAQDEEINSSMSLHFIKCMSVLEAVSDKKPILIIINSTGGDIHASFAMYDRIVASPCEVVVCGYSAVMSGASIIQQAADIREMTPHSYMMIHDGSVTLQDDMTKAKSWMNAYDSMSEQMYDIYFNRAVKKNKKLTRDSVVKMCKEETILTAQQALDIGFIDKVFKG